ncbi:putative histidine acid phosphatase [Aspergillus clavatus NRRL 1]|uniref:3-phytase n=1 Tax=Aspergillus clavatus (strain ATCC 1007 / CBS 513.65 / DSM 816 / NCTC 3887 / NRRL 1 / QM 1276 / 107) TaxID=344612 RepID=A1CU18_ASPCL|nr:histidine acid phosphatase, putative [Aspergillus clavatus NRRL 1]EAW06805.1 histidine acid phosphatase, putative [Aspergillus clavatus NRRL 1]
MKAVLNLQVNHTILILCKIGLGYSASVHAFDTWQHLGANSPWFAGPNVNKISPDVPDKCTVDQAVYVSRHGSRYPDPGAYAEWQALHDAIQSAKFRASGSLSFLSDWEPVLRYPDQQISQLSIAGYKELYNFGVDLRFRYPSFYEDNTPFLLWANDYQRTIDSARLFARGYLGSNSSYGDIHVITAGAETATGNSLATSDMCPTFKDVSGGSYASTWDDTYLPAITKRLNRKISGNLTLTDAQVSTFPYLCGFETQITGSTSPWCDVFTEKEILQYEYRQDLRYYYGTGPGAGNNMTVMLPVLQGIVNLLEDGPAATANTSTGANKLPPLIVAFTHDNQINELASLLGVFDEQKPLPADKMDKNRIYVSSRVNPMRGTIAFERLRCTSQGKDTVNVRIRLNDAVYPVPSCRSGPGKSCPLDQYAELVVKKRKQYGSFASVCGLPDGNVTTAGVDGAVTFFRDLTLPFMRVVKP